MKKEGKSKTEKYNEMKYIVIYTRTNYKTFTLKLKIKS